ncbi:MAG: HPr(Ser) kinase/phosphatase [Fusobacteriaceae bacterium]|jgi:HPr kinase/phosphorylase|nr:HPr(Ser) kinase/phosphatase [Fusobacteriaceae bacterium]
MNPTIQDLIDKLELEVLNPGDPARQIERPNIYQIGYELTGFFSYSGEDLEQSVQVCGRKELMYMRTLSEQVLIALLTKYFSYRFPALVITWDDEAMERILVRLATIHNVTLLKSKKDTPVTIRELKFFLQKNFVEEMILPGYTFLEIYGIGVLITGYEDAKIGVAIELLDRGHRIITDDNVLIRRLAENYLEGCNRLDKSVEDSHFFLQNQKDGTKIDVTTQYGIKSTRAKKKIDLLIVLEEWNEKEFYDRLGLDEIYAEFLGERVPKIVLPVRKGRNLAVILEAAAMNSRLKIIGENSAEIFVAETKKIIEENKKMQGDKDMDKKRIGVLALKNQFGLKVITGEKALETTQVTTVSIHRPALALSGFFDIYEDPENICIQIFSNDEFRYLNGLPGERRNEILEKYLSYPFPMLVTTVDTEVPSWFLELVRKRGLILCKSPYKKVSQVIANFNGYLETAFNPTLSVHGVFLELYGFGVLIIGKSQIGKSETALELIHRGHRLVADDFVKFSRDTGGAVVGRAARLPYFMEVRGLGVIDIKALYGLGAVRLNKRLDFVIEMREQKTEDYLTSLHYESGAYEILNKNIPKIVLYMSSGRNAAAMVEIAVMNRMARALGHDPDKLYREGLKKLTDEERKLIEENPR